MEPSGHCPYLGLKQNRAIRFASPTPEHRCYVSGEPIDIPVDQASYCLSQGHIHCPLYTGSMLPTIEQAVAQPDIFAIADSRARSGGLRGWMETLSPRDRAIYALMVGLLGLIAAIYLFLGLQSLLSREITVAPPAPTSAAVGVVATAAPTAAPTSVPPTPTSLPTSIPTARPTAEPTAASVLFPPTQIATAAPTVVPSTAEATAVPATAQPTGVSTAVPATAQPTGAPTIAPPTARPSSIPATGVPASPQPTAAPTQAPVVDVTQELVTLYFGDETGSLYVPVQRTVRVENNQVASAAVRALITGPQNGLQALLLPTTKLVGLTIDNGTAIVNFDRRPTSDGDIRGYNAVVLTLTHFPTVRQVQFQINGQNTGIGDSGPEMRPILNPLNPDQLPEGTATTAFLPLYFPLNDGVHDVRIIRLVPKTNETARATINALLEGPGSYGYAVQQVIPDSTELRGVSLDTNTRVITVDFTQPFAGTMNREAAVRNIVQSLTTLPDVRGVQILVEGRPLADQWGEAYRNGFGKPQINPE